MNNNEKTVQLDTKETLSDLTYMVNSGWDKSEVDDGYYYYPDTTCMLYFYANEAPVEIADDAFFQLFIINFLEKNQDAEYLNVSSAEVLGVPSKIWSINQTIDSELYEIRMQVFIYDYQAYNFLILHKDFIPDEQLQCFSQIIDSIEIKD